MMRHALYSLVFILMMAACTSNNDSSPSIRDLQLGEQLIDENFDAVGNWDTSETDGLYLNVEDGVYHSVLNWRGRWLWGTNSESHNDVVVEVDVNLGESTRLTMAGIVCRSSPQGTGEGYYFLISAKGEFSIRKGLNTSADELISWQEHSAIYTDGQINRLRAVCVGNSLQFFVNDDYLAGVNAGNYRRGFTGVVVGQPTNASGVSDVTFDNLRIWEASMP
ncbi:MAG: hypothetical protein Q9P44_20640 [Anaerolineae bacterium]|nr:hypothetical protein [Anaerolineae bacterium]